MSKFSTLFAAALLSVTGIMALLPVQIASAAGLEREGWVTHQTKHSFKQMNMKLDGAISDEKMGLVTQASASKGAQSRGVSIPGNRIVGVYRNDFAVRMLEASIASGIEAPIRFYVTQNADGGSTLSYKTPTTVFSPYFDEGGEALTQMASELDAILQKFLPKQLPTDNTGLIVHGIW